MWTETQAGVSFKLLALTSRIISKVSSWQKAQRQEQRKRQNQQNAFCNEILSEAGRFFLFIARYHETISYRHFLFSVCLLTFYLVVFRNQTESKWSCRVI